MGETKGTRKKKISNEQAKEQVKVVLANLQSRTEEFIEKSRESAEIARTSDSFTEYNEKNKEVDALKDSIVAQLELAIKYLENIEE